MYDLAKVRLEQALFLLLLNGWDTSEAQDAEGRWDFCLLCSQNQDVPELPLRTKVLSLFVCWSPMFRSGLTQGSYFVQYPRSSLSSTGSSIWSCLAFAVSGFVFIHPPHQPRS